jgi:transposase-like protein
MEGKFEELEKELESIEKEMQSLGLHEPEQEKKLMARNTTTKETPEKVTNGYTVSDLAEEFEVTPQEMRRYLRTLEIERPGKSWTWAKKTDPSLKELRPKIREYIKSLGSDKGKKPTAPKKPQEEKSPPKKKVSSRRKVVVEEESE